MNLIAKKYALFATMSKKTPCSYLVVIYVCVTCVRRAYQSSLLLGELAQYAGNVSRQLSQIIYIRNTIIYQSWIEMINIIKLKKYRLIK